MSRTRFVSTCLLGMAAYLAGHSAGKRLGLHHGLALSRDLFVAGAGAVKRG